MFHDAEEVPSPGGHFAQNEIQPQPQYEQRAVETWRPACHLRPYIIRKVFPNVTSRLQAWIAYKVVIIKDELEIQCGAVDGEDCCRQRRRCDGKGHGRERFRRARRSLRGGSLLPSIRDGGFRFHG